MTGSSLGDAIKDRSAVVGIIGCGYVGLPLAAAFAKAGYRVTAVDVDVEKVRKLNAGESYIRDVPSDDIAGLVKQGRLRATTSYESLREAHIIFVAVPTPFDRAKQPDLSYIIRAAEGIAGVLQRGQLIVLESTTYPGTTDEVMRPILERSGLTAGADFYLAFSPERIDPGNKTFGIENTPKVVGGIDPESTALAAAALQQITQGRIHTVSSARVAELTKLLENTFRAVNIALVNDLAMLCDRMGIDIWEVIDAAATKPYGFMPFYPGPGVGGHCIPVDPYYLSWKAREFDFHTKFIELAGKIKPSMPYFCVDKIERVLNEHGKPVNGSRILLLGVSYKPGVGDLREAPPLRIIKLLGEGGADLAYHDPHVPSLRDPALESVPFEPELEAADLVVIVTAHPEVDYRRGAPPVPVPPPLPRGAGAAPRPA